VLFPSCVFGAAGAGGDRCDGQFRRSCRRQNQQKDQPEPADGPQKGNTLDDGSQEGREAPDAEKAI